jgi:hypothetical protein
MEKNEEKASTLLDKQDFISLAFEIKQGSDFMKK